MYNEQLDGNMQDEHLCVMKRSGKRVPWKDGAIANAVNGASDDMRHMGQPQEAMRFGSPSDGPDEDTAWGIERGVKNYCSSLNRDASVEEIQDLVQKAIMQRGHYAMAVQYITYRFKHNEARKMTTVDQKIAGIIELNNEEVKQENSNKNPTILSVQRDYMAGEWSRYYTNKYILPDDVVEAHRDGIIHFHDADYFAQHMSNCCLVNLDDMLQNGTCISGTHIDRPKSFATACTVASQIVAQVASSQYGLKAG